MNENLLRRIKKRLNEKFYVMNDAWLRDCIEFFIADKAPHEITDGDILKFVEGQWQLSDLREISNENGCLPRNLVQQTCTVLPDTYILQVDKMYDIASAKYKQLCEIRKIDGKNLEVTEAEKSEEEWQPKGRRMMQLCLTDGIQDVTAIEYTPIKQITGTLLPGYKIMIIGPINCRRGIILLENGKYKEIGGEVESLLKSNALENVLARALEEPENPDPYNDNASSRITNQNGQNTALNSNNDSFFDDDFEEVIDLEEVTVIERRKEETESVQENTCSHGQVTRKETNEITEDTLEDIDFEPLENCQQNENSLKKKTEMYPVFKVPRLKSNCSALLEVEKCTVTKAAESGKSVVNTLRAVQQVPKTITIPNFFEPQTVPKTCDVLSDVLREPITGKIYRTVKCRVKNLVSKLTKQGKCWSLTAIIADHTSSVEVCFNSKILEEFLGFTVAEFLQKKKLAKLDPQVNNELRLSLRKAQQEIQNLDALLKLELAQDQMPEVIDITLLSAQEKEDLMKRGLRKS
ncbi:recQ-mediated genome instability protein 1 isoform X3 [Solenopsis invicta]|uniref:recQ-mediated genome instability protein 1 isoform X3 n=1 Tax=Solenopsis invicta TaxID=13686 RepID=UPI0001FE8AB7|nr:recQ-mediated genome instability protein 1 isoform X3 [Solenopsis invicta]